MQKILLQLDTDAQASAFDRIVAIDSGIDHVLSYSRITPENVVSIVHGAIFTRGPKDLQNTAICVGGSDIAVAEKVVAVIRNEFIGPMSVSVMLDPNGAVTTAAAAVRCAAEITSLQDKECLVLGGTGPVGQMAGQILASQGGRVRIASRTLQRAEQVASTIRNQVEDAKVTACESTDDGLAAAVDGVEVIIAAGAAGVKFLTTDEWRSIDTLNVAIDLNAVPPPGLEGIAGDAFGVKVDNIVTFGALGVGKLKMKTHKAALQKLFTSNSLVLNPEAVYELSVQFV